MRYWGRVVSTGNMHVLIYGLHTHTAAVNGQLAASFSNPDGQSPCVTQREEGRLKSGKMQVCCYFWFPQYIFHSSVPVLFLNLIQSQHHIWYLFISVGLFISPPYYFLSSTSYLTPAYQNELRVDRLHRHCLSAWVIHGNGKVQTGEVGGHGFLLFFLLDAFFLKSLTGLKLKKPKVPQLVLSPATLKQSPLCSFTAWVEGNAWMSSSRVDDVT